MPKRTARIKDGKVSFLSLCPKGKNKLKAIYKADGNFTFDGPIVKADEEKGILKAIAYAPNHVDADGDFADPVAIEKLAFSFMRDGKGIDVLHDEQALDKSEVYVAESYIVKKGDPDFAGLKDSDGNDVDATGAWAVTIKMDSERARTLYREQGWEGISMGGVAVKEPVAKSDEVEAEGVLRWLKSLFGQGRVQPAHKAETPDPSGDEDMNEEQIKALVETMLKAHQEEIKKADAAAEPQEEAIEVDVEFEYEGDTPTIEEAIAYAEAVEKAQFVKRIEKAAEAGDLKKLRAIQKEMAKSLRKGKRGSKQFAASGAPDLDTEDAIRAEVAELNKAEGLA